MTNETFKTLLGEVFQTHMFMSKRNHHTVNELLYCLRNDVRFKDMNLNISIVTANGNWLAISTIDAFVDIGTLGIWFDDDTIEYELEECGEEKFDCITIYEREVK